MAYSRTKDPNYLQRVAKLSWWQYPKHWQKVIAKIDTHTDYHNNVVRVKVLPWSPEYMALQDERYLNESAPPSRYFDEERNAILSLPARYLDPITFDSLEELDAWARVAARLEK